MTAEIDMRMSDWRGTYMCQDHPGKLQKIKACLNVVKEILRPEYSLLDVGCGRGHVYHELGHKNYTGIDLSDAEVAAAREAFPDGNFKVGDLYDIDGKWDVVLCSRVLLHVAPLKGAMEKLLNASGKFLILVAHVGPHDVVEEIIKDDRRFYFRTISEDTLKSFGDCEFHNSDRTRYTTIVYKR